MTDADVRQLVAALRPDDRTARQVPNWMPLALTAVSLIVGATAYLAPQSDRINRVEGMVQTERTAARETHLALDRQISEVTSQVQRSEETTRAALAQIQADISVIKTRLDQDTPPALRRP